MTGRLAPGTILAAVLACTLIFAAVPVWLALSQPWLGATLALRDGAVMIRSADDDGALAGRTGSRLVAIGAPGALTTLEPDDLVEEPDLLADSDRIRRFFARQDALSAALRAGPVQAVLDSQGTQHTLELIPSPARPLTDLPWPFWAQILVGVVGLSLGGWVVTLRPRDRAAWMLLVTGAGLALAAQSAAVYSARELALGFGVYSAASRFNSFGTLLFGIGMVTLFQIYPKRLTHGAALWAPACAIALGMVCVLALDWPTNMPLMQPLVATIMLVLLAVIAAQVWANRRDPAARAMMGWLGLSVAIGAGAFVLTVVVPHLLDRPPVVRQSTAFLFFLVIYAGVAMGVARFRLFDLADWSLGVLFYAVGVAVLLLLDALLVFGLALDRLPALSLSLALVCLTYLPMRQRLAGWRRRGSGLGLEELYRRITEIAHADAPGARLAQSQRLWTDLFRPLSIRPAEPGEFGAKAGPVPFLADDGRTLFVPPVAGLPALRLDMANRGARLFSSRDLRQVQTIGQLLADALIRHDTYTRAVATERARINRDMHDNIGMLLISALHNTDTGRKDALIRQTLTDLREIVSKPAEDPWDLLHLLADLRAEVADVLEAAGIALRWTETGLPDTKVPPRTAMTLRAVLREGVSNIVRHSGASEARVALSVTQGVIRVRIDDDGCGIGAVAPQHSGVQPSPHRRIGNGLVNLRARLAEPDEAFAVQSSATGTTLTADIPLARVVA